MGPPVVARRRAGGATLPDSVHGVCRLPASGDACCGLSDIECLEAVIVDGQGRAAAGGDGETISSRRMGRDEALQADGRSEAVHGPFTFSKRKVAILCAVTRLHPRPEAKHGEVRHAPIQTPKPDRDHARQAQALGARCHRQRPVSKGLPFGHRSRRHRNLLAINLDPTPPPSH